MESERQHPRSSVAAAAMLPNSGRYMSRSAGGMVHSSHRRTLTRVPSTATASSESTGPEKQVLQTMIYDLLQASEKNKAKISLSRQKQQQHCQEQQQQQRQVNNNAYRIGAVSSTGVTMDDDLLGDGDSDLDDDADAIVPLRDHCDGDGGSASMHSDGIVGNSKNSNNSSRGRPVPKHKREKTGETTAFSSPTAAATTSAAPSSSASASRHRRRCLQAQSQSPRTPNASISPSTYHSADGTNSDGIVGNSKNSNNSSRGRPVPKHKREKTGETTALSSPMATATTTAAPSSSAAASRHRRRCLQTQSPRTPNASMSPSTTYHSADGTTTPASASKHRRRGVVKSYSSSSSRHNRSIMPPPPCNFDPAGSAVETSHSKSKSRHRRRRFPLNDEEGVVSPSTTTSSASRRAERKLGGGGGVVAAASKPTSQLSEAALADLYYSHISGSGPSEVYQNEVAAAPGPSRHLRRQKSGDGSKSGRRRNQKPGDANARRRLKKSVSASDAHVLPSHRGQVASSSSTRMQRTTAAAMSESISSFPDQSFAEISLEEEELPSAPMPGNVANANTGANANAADIDEELVQAMIDQHIPMHLRNQFPHDVMRAILLDASSHNKNGSWGGSGHQQTQRPSTFTNLTDGVNLRPKSQSSFMVDRLNNIDGIPDMVDLQSFADDISLESLSVFTEPVNLASAGDVTNANAATKRQPRLPPPSNGQVRHKAADELDEDDDIDDDIDYVPPKPLVNVDTQDDDEINDDCDVNHPGRQCNTNGTSRFDTIDGNASTMTPLPPVRTISTYDNTDVPMTPVTHVSHGAQSTGASTIAPSVIPNRHRTDDSGIYPPSLEQQQQQNSSYSKHIPSNKPFHMLKTSTNTTNTLETVPISMASAASSTSQSQQQEGCVRQQQVQPHVHTVVSFGNVNIRYYETVIVVNPACRCGPSVGIGWMYQDGGKMDLGPIPSDDDIDNLENRNRKKQSQLILSKDQRHQRLLDWGYTNQDIASSIRQLRKYKNQRKQTVNNLPAAGMEEAMESAKRKILSILVANKSS
eukprot:CAMPEP_0119572200 /NCGR_PEP_ID=MMETSP1352-20130426/44503_1 /TAXON_ID=265584 /ORGANISM="Stauroneis constricta, Strain CCMP1120" /LENGTH=1038 /DNA_ID=CAMNT_0007621885 /DNA_START=90 /DNA_END=3206 /DNA_ORIENTATION=-